MGVLSFALLLQAVSFIAGALAGAARAAEPPRANAASSTQERLAPFRGLGTWLDLHEYRGDPTARVTSMAAHGVGTLYVEGSNYSHGSMVSRPYLATLLEQAHEHGIKVIAWTLPGFRDLARDRRQILAVRDFRPGGERFDGYAMDIEATVVPSVTVRDRRALALLSWARSALGAGYPLGAIIPSPSVIAKASGFWNDFPYAAVAARSDVLMPMSYSTMLPEGRRDPAGYVAGDVGLLREQVGQDTPIHSIAGLSAGISVSAAGQIAGEMQILGVIGGSLYEFEHTSAGAWAALAPLRALASS
jgi:hypothetical protein